MNSRPDIVLLVLDTHRVDRLSCYGYPRETSPYLDAFAADSTLFRHAVSAAQSFSLLNVHGTVSFKS